jgi:ATP-binding cassette subfamily B protein
MARRSPPLLRLIRHFRHHSPAVKVATAYSILNKLADLAPPVLIGMAVDTVVEQEHSLLASVGFIAAETQLVVLAVLTVLVWGAESIFEYLYAKAWRTLAQTVQHELRLDAWDHAQRLDLSWHAERSRGEAMSILNDDVNQLERFLDGGANALLQVATTALTVGTVFFFLSPGVAAWSMAPIPFILVGSFWFQARIAPLYSRVRADVGRMNAILDNTLAGQATVRSYTGEDREVERLKAASDRYRRSNTDAIRVSAAFVPIIRMFILVAFTATLVDGGHRALSGEMAVGTYSLLVFLTQRLLWPLTSLGQTFDLYQRAMASTARILDLLDVKVQLVDGPETLDRADGTIAFEGLTFGYPGRATILHNLHLRIEAGQTVAVVGATGAGKSTLVRLLNRFHDPDSGRVTLDGHPLPDLTLADLRRNIAVVDQQTFLFPGSVFENIQYGRPGASREDVIAAAKAAEAHDFIAALPAGYDTRIGEDGKTLSGGQRQRLSLARAVLKDAPILVLDEATSAVDNETEAAIQRSLAQVSRGRTTLVIAHRLSTVRDADEIVVLDQGRIAERGRHDDLVARKGAYARLWAVQTGERIDA